MSNFTDSFLSANTGSFPSEQLPSLRQRLSQLDDSQANQVIAAANIKNPTTALILSIFLGGFGVDRFYIGNTGLGIGKLLTTVLHSDSHFRLHGFGLLAIGSLSSMRLRKQTWWLSITPLLQ